MIYEFNPQIYPRKIWIYIGEDEEKVKNYFIEDGSIKLSKRYYAITCNVRKKGTNMLGYLIWFHKKSEVTPSISAHEATHAALHIIDDIGGDVDLKNQEYISYLIDWIVECIYKVKNIKKEST
ncbi:MAG: hypothetical protein RR513_10075, partial [Muribaculaceae bacterium]